MGLCSPEGPRTLTKPSNVGKGEGVPAKSYTSHSTTCMFSRCSAGSLPTVIPVLLTCWPFTTVLCRWAALPDQWSKGGQTFWRVGFCQTLLPTGKQCFRFGYCWQVTKTVNIFSLPVLLGLLTLLYWTATSREIALGAARVLQLLQVDFAK